MYYLKTRSTSKQGHSNVLKGWTAPHARRIRGPFFDSSTDRSILNGVAYKQLILMPEWVCGFKDGPVHARGSGYFP